MIRTTYFRHRRPFLLRPHPYDIGIFLGVKPGYEDNHFLKKIYSLSAGEYPAFYQYHLSYFLESSRGADEQEFFSHVWLRVTNRIHHYELQDPFSPKHSLYVSNISHLIAFRKFLVSIDRWNHHKSLEELLAEKENQIAALKQENDRLNTRIAALMEYEPAEKIRIVKGKLPTVIDLFLQLQELTVPEGSKLFGNMLGLFYQKLS